jgi:UDP-N-acetylmuramate dehydrogenase
MNMQEFKIFKDQNNSNLKFDFPLKNLNWMNIGGSAKVFFKPENLKSYKFFKIVPKYKKHVLERDLSLLVKIGENFIS